MVGLTNRQAEILKYILEFIKENGLPPTAREVSDKFGITCKGAYDHIEALVKKGYIKKIGMKKSRNIQIIKDFNCSEVNDDREICRQEFVKTAIEDTSYNWYIWKRAWTTARVRA